MLTLLSMLEYGNLVHVHDGCMQQLCIENCDQTAADRDMVTTVSYHYRPIHATRDSTGTSSLLFFTHCQAHLGRLHPLKCSTSKISYTQGRF